MKNSPSAENHDEVMTDEEQSYQEFQKIVDREVEIERLRLQTLSYVRNFIRETDWDDQKIAAFLEVDEEYVKNTRFFSRGLSREEQNKTTLEVNVEQLVNQVYEVISKIRYAYYVCKDGTIDANALDEAVSMHTWTNLARVKRIRMTMFPPGREL